jgi:serine/threonine-protein kinase
METKERRVGRYLLLEPLGRGAMGTVYRAEDPFIRRTVAVKVLHTDGELTPQLMRIARERFKREAEAAGRIDHPSVIRIFDVGEDETSGEMYLVMEYLPGPSLERLLDEGGLSLERGAQLIGQIASGIDAAHAQGIVHRDIKPSNILLTDDGAAKIVDFGITRIGSSVLTQDTRNLGTPAYMSPEHVHGHDVDARSDLFSLGVVSYEILARKKPFDGTNAVSIAYAIAHSQPRPISDANPTLPRTLDEPFQRMLSKEPSERFASGREFNEALLGCLLGVEAPAKRPVVLPPPRHGLLWGLGILIALAALVVVLVALRGKPVPAPAPTTARAPARAPVTAPEKAAKPPKPAVVKAIPQRPPPPPPPPTAELSISLAHWIARGTLTVSLDGKPVFAERFQKAKLALQQTTTWDPLKAPAGAHTLTARVNGDNGKTYLSKPYRIELEKAAGAAVRIAFKGSKLTIVSSPAAR